MTPSAISKWKSTLEKEGIEGLKSTNCEGSQGPDSELDDQDREQLVKLLEQEAQTHVLEADLLTSKCVAALIEEEFEVNYTPAITRGLSANLATVPSNLTKGHLRKIPKRKDTGSTEKLSSKKTS